MIKEDFLRLLKEDADFRKQVEEILGINTIVDIKDTLKKIIESIDKLRDSVNQLVEAQKKSEERLAKLEEIAANHEKRLAKLEELQIENEKRIKELSEVQKKSEDRLAKLEEAIEKLTEAQKKNEERLAKLEEAIERLTEAQKKNEEKLAAFQETTGKKIEEIQKRSDEKFAEIGKILKETAEQIAKLTETIREHDKMLGSIGKRWGREYENIVKLFFKEIMDQEGIDYQYINKFTYKDDSGIYGYKGKRYEIDIFARDHKIYLIEVKSSADADDIEWFDLKTHVIIDALKLQGEIVRLFLAITVTKGALEASNRYGIKLVYYDVIEIKDEEGDVVSG